MAKKIIVFSDNHNYDGDMLKILKKEKYDLAINCGDHMYSSKKVLKIFDYYVDGNNDLEKKEKESFNIENKKITIVHGHKQWSYDFNEWVDNLRKLGEQENSDIVLFGHSHIAFVDKTKTPYVANPGSISLPRSENIIGSYMIITIEENDINFEIKTI